MNVSYFKILLPALLIVGLFGSGLILDNSHKNNKSLLVKQENAQKTLRHIVFFSFNEDATADVIEDAGQTLLALEGSIDVIQSIEWGETIAEGQEYSHCLLVNFDSEEDLGIYFPHPAHQRFLSDFSKYFNKVAVVDYWVTE